ncbi:MAG: osmoprotectant transporter permease [Hyphomicrobiales bacterium]|nr:MAG: osmoprotectant transporter permease [Hyphomicrobiales bacterium]
MAVDGIICALAGVFFMIGLKDGSIGPENIGLWGLIFAVLALIVGGGSWLQSAGHHVLSLLLLMVLAVPGLLSGLFILLFALSGTQWR